MELNSQMSMNAVKSCEVIPALAGKGRSFCHASPKLYSQGHQSCIMKLVGKLERSNVHAPKDHCEELPSVVRLYSKPTPT